MKYFGLLLKQFVKLILFGNLKCWSNIIHLSMTNETLPLKFVEALFCGYLKDKKIYQGLLFHLTSQFFQYLLLLSYPHNRSKLLKYWFSTWKTCYRCTSTTVGRGRKIRSKNWQPRRLFALKSSKSLTSRCQNRNGRSFPFLPAHPVLPNQRRLFRITTSCRMISPFG